MSGRRARAIRGGLVRLLLAASLLGGAGAAHAAPLPPDEVGAIFALVVGVNHPGAGVDRRPLRYADDDAARWFDLFRALGGRVHLHARLDDQTRSLHAQAAAEAAPATPAALAVAVARLHDEVEQARGRRVPTRLYVVYAGHGSAGAAGEALTLDEGVLTTVELAEMVAAVGADRTHVIVDACDAWAFAYTGARGPGGERRELRGFSRRGPLADRDDVGLLLGASATRETHEWEVIQAGVFGHLVRSGLYGAADADGDGRIAYREIAAFVDRAGAAIPNERFRPTVHVRPPAGASELLDLRPAHVRRIELDGPVHGRLVLENRLGVRLVDLHSPPDARVRLVRPAGVGPLYLRVVGDGADVEYAIPPGPDTVRVAALPSKPPRTAPRGAAHHAFRALFALPFDASVVDAWVPHEPPASPGPAIAHHLALGYALRSGVLRGAELAQGISAAWALAVGRWRPRVEVAWTRATYDVAAGFPVSADEVGGTVGLDVRLLGAGRLALLTGVAAGGGWVWQRGDGPAGAQRRDGGLLRYRGAIAVEWAPAGAVALFARGSAGQAFVDAVGGWRGRFEAALDVGVEARF